MDYDPQQFASEYHSENKTELGPEIWHFLTSEASIARLETASFFKKPALEALSPFLVTRFGNWIATDDRAKQMIGHMVRQILEARGYKMVEESAEIKSKTSIFGTAARYKKKGGNGLPSLDEKSTNAKANGDKPDGVKPKSVKPNDAKATGAKPASAKKTAKTATSTK